MMTNNAPQAVGDLTYAARRMRSTLPRPVRGEALRKLRLQRIVAHIEENLADPDLCAPKAARSLGLSVRGLHLALAPERDSFNVLVQRRRLAACLVLLQRPGHDERIADIAFACGFNSLSSFYRAFRSCFGACPRALDARDATDAEGDASVDARQGLSASIANAAC